MATTSLSKKPKKCQKIWLQQQASMSAPDVSNVAVKDEDYDAYCNGARHNPNLLKSEPYPRYDSAFSRSVSPAKSFQRSLSHGFDNNDSNTDHAVRVLFRSRAFTVCAVMDPEIDAVGMIEEMYHDTIPGSCLDISTRAAALSNMSNRLDSIDIWTEAQHQYGVALQALNTTLQNPLERLTDETLLAMLMIRFCEVCTAHEYQLHQHEPDVSLVLLRPSCQCQHVQSQESVL